MNDHAVFLLALTMQREIVEIGHELGIDSGTAFGCAFVATVTGSLGQGVPADSLRRALEHLIKRVEGLGRKSEVN